MSKQCNTCGETKPQSEFHKRAASPDGTQYKCKVCQVAHVNKNHDENPLGQEYKAWLDAKLRVTNPNHRQWANYGGRGITMCEEWADMTLSPIPGLGYKPYPMGFIKFLLHIGRKPSDTLSLDRVNNDEGYEPGNVAWRTAKEQANNRRPLNRKKVRKALLQK